MSAPLLHPDGLHRCPWPGKDDALYVAYHDNEWGVPEYDDRALYEKAFAAVRDTISPDGQMPADGPANCLKFLAEGDPAIKPASIKLADTWTNEFAARAGKRS